VSAPDDLLELDRSAGVDSSPAFRAARNSPPQAIPGRATGAAAFHAARRTYLDGRRLDMEVLAAELDVARSTLDDWTGPRERLLADVLWSLSDLVFEQAKADHPEHSGVSRLLAIYRQHVAALVQSQSLQTFLLRESRGALRVLTGSDRGVHPRTVASLAGLYREEQQVGAFAPRTDVATLAYAVVRVTEGFIYSDTLIADRPAVRVQRDVERAAQVVTRLLV
jgi:hypothetical protein